MKNAIKFLFLFVFLTNFLFADNYTYTLQKGWNNIGVFLDLTESSANALLSHQLYEFKRQENGGAFVQADDVKAGKAYWIYVAEETQLTVSGSVVQNLVPGGDPASLDGKYQLTESINVDAGTMTTRTAPEVSGYAFTEWSTSGITLPDKTARTITFAMPANPVKLTPNYRKTYFYTLTVDGKAEQVESGDVVTRIAPDKSGYFFTGWTADGVTLADRMAKTISFTMPFCNVTLTSNYTNKFPLTVDGSTSQKTYGESVSVTAPDKTGYTFKEWTVEGVTVSKKTSKTLSFKMPSNEVVLTSSYTVNKYTLTFNGKGEQVEYGATVTKTAPEKSGYAFKDWTVSGVTIADKTQETISFTMPANAVTLTANYEKSTSSGKTYMVVTLSTGDVRYTDAAPDLNDDNCRTTELWLRRIPKGTFTMGSPVYEFGRDDDEIPHKVTLTKDYYIGIFEMTQQQYTAICGDDPACYLGGCRPVECVSYDMIRGGTVGAGWPSNNNVDSESILGKLRTKTGLLFDLPTEAQWEYACRAGTTTALNTGKNLTDEYEDSAMDKAGRYEHNCDDNKGGGYDEHTKVGSYPPNAWGLYDMHGNVWEWCLDWYGSYSGNATDPPGAQSGSYRVWRGGSWGDYALNCRSASRNYDDPWWYDFNDLGFRVAFVPVQ